MPKVHIIGCPWEYKELFLKHRWQVVDDPMSADLIQFTGGEDVSPGLYGEAAHATTQNNPDRDRREAVLFRTARGWGIPMAGICRGGQFLNVMCGGKLYQHVDGHDRGFHEATDLKSKRKMWVTSTHHQMMIPGKGGEVTMKAGNSSKKAWMPSEKKESTTFMPREHLNDVEAIVYKDHRVFCFQPHPEYKDQDQLAAYYIYQLFEHLLEGDIKHSLRN